MKTARGQADLVAGSLAAEDHQTAVPVVDVGGVFVPVPVPYWHMAVAPDMVAGVAVADQTAVPVDAVAGQRDCPLVVVGLAESSSAAQTARRTLVFDWAGMAVAGADD